MESILTEIVTHSSQLGLKVGVIFLPDRLQYDPAFNTPDNLWEIVGIKTRREWLTKESELQIRLKDWSQKNQVPFFDLTPTFREATSKSNTPLTWQNDHHWTIAGNRVAAGAIANWLKEIDFLDFKTGKN